MLRGSDAKEAPADAPVPLQGPEPARRIAGRPDGSHQRRRGGDAPAGTGASAGRGAAGFRSPGRDFAARAAAPAAAGGGAPGPVHPATGDPAGCRAAAGQGAVDPAGHAGRRTRARHHRRRARRGPWRRAVVDRARTPARRVQSPLHQHGPRRRGRRQPAGHPGPTGRLPRTQPQPARPGDQRTDLSGDPGGGGRVRAAVPAGLCGAAVLADVREPGCRIVLVHPRGDGDGRVRAAGLFL